MYIPSTQQVLAASMAFLGTFTDPSKVASGKVLDFEVQKCIDAEKNVRCSKPFLVQKSKCYNIEWSTDGAISHTTAEVRDAGSDEIVYYRDTNGEWTPEKGELVYLDFAPKIAGQGNKTVEYKVTTCE